MADMTRRTSNRFREMLDNAHRLGFEDVGWRRNGHFRVQHPNGSVVDISGSPGDLRGDRNNLLELERKSGRKLPRQSSGSFSHVRVRCSDFSQSSRERSACAVVDELVSEADCIRARFAALAAEGEGVAEAKRLVRRYSNIEDELAAFHRSLPPIY